jgi:DNA invertase Pin-like site-specific DNA recombinase
LVARARSLGWEHVIVIDDDLGRSGGGQHHPGFERLLAAICAGTVGAVLAIEASRLARNGRDWHTLLEFCAFVNSLIIGEDGVYDPRLVSDGLLLGLKGTFSELALSIFRQRSQETLRLKAARSDLYTTVAIGYRRSPDDRLEQDPDLLIREALSLVFRKFSEIGSVRQLALWLRQERIDLPIAVYGRPGADRAVAPATLQYGSSAADQSGLCWGLCLWAHRLAGPVRRWTQSHHSRRRAPAGGVGGADPRPP